jgi:hypothetical protein
MNQFEGDNKMNSKRRRYTLALGTLYYIVVAVIFYFLLSPRAIIPATIPFTDGFESGNSSAWNSGIWTKGTGAVSFVNSPVYRGNWAMKCQITAAAPNSDYAEIDESFGTSHSTIYMRIYFEVTTLPASGQAVELVELADNIHKMNNFGLGYSGGTPQWRLTYLKNGGYAILYASSPTPTINTWYCLELMVTVDGANGSVKGYINGALIFSDSGFKNNNYGNASWGTCGLDTWTNENYPNVGYFDEVAISAQFIIGP